MKKKGPKKYDKLSSSHLISLTSTWRHLLFCILSSSSSLSALTWNTSKCLVTICLRCWKKEKEGTRVEHTWQDEPYNFTYNRAEEQRGLIEGHFPVFDTGPGSMFFIYLFLTKWGFVNVETRKTVIWRSKKKKSGQLKPIHPKQTRIKSHTKCAC